MQVTVFHWSLTKNLAQLSEADASLHSRFLFGDQSAVEELMRRESSAQDPFMELVKVADVEARSLNQVFELTNHIESDWTENEGVSAVPGRHRSTSVGDVYLSGSDFYCVAMMGLRKLQLDAPGPAVEEPVPSDSPRG